MRFNPAYPAMLAHDWKKKGKPDPTGWWASEKYDGLRALWDGENFYSRNGKIFHAPQWFKDTLPSTPLDGELWGERSVAGFQKAMSAVRKKVGGKEWENITYMVFDIPTSTEPFEKVQAKLKRMNLGEYAEVAPQHKVRSQADMMKRYEAALSEGAEGLMLRKPGSRYAATRSASLLKVKPKDTAEAVVTGYQGGTGKHQGRMGALKVYLLGDKSKKFKIGTGFSDRERESPPSIGSIVEFKFNDKTARGIPRFPAFLRVRTDMMADRPKRKATKPARKKTVAKKKDREGLFDPKHYWARRVTKKYKYSRGSGSGQYPAKVGDWELDETHYDATFDGNAVYETEDASYVHPQDRKYGISIIHDSRPEGEAWDFDYESYPTLRAALAALKGSVPIRKPTTVYRTKKAPAKRKAAPKRKTRKAAPSKSRRSAAKSSRTAANYFSMGSADLVALGDAGSKKELKRRGRDPRTGKKVRR